MKTIVTQVKIFLALAICYQITPTSAIFGWGPCPNVPVADLVSLKEGFSFSLVSLDAVSFLGTWYTILKTTDFKFIKGNCSQSYYSLNPDGRIQALLSEIKDGKNTSIIGEVFLDTLTDGQLHVKIFRFLPLGDLKIIHTDYKNSALLFACKSFIIFHWMYAWVN